LLIGGDKTGDDRFYRRMIPIADRLYDEHLVELTRERSQHDLARVLKVGQPAVAKLEKRTDMYVSNLRRYIEALGGKLEITARFSDTAVTIANFGDLAAGKRRPGKRKSAN
jgi:Helix-turn-helix domain